MIPTREQQREMLISKLTGDETWEDFIDLAINHAIQFGKQVVDKCTENAKILEDDNYFRSEKLDLENSIDVNSILKTKLELEEPINKNDDWSNFIENFEKVFKSAKFTYSFCYQLKVRYDKERIEVLFLKNKKINKWYPILYIKRNNMKLKTYSGALNTEKTLIKNFLFENGYSKLIK